MDGAFDKMTVISETDIITNVKLVNIKQNKNVRNKKKGLSSSSTRH